MIDVHIDGSSLGNPGICGVAYVTKTSEGSKNVGFGTNNYAELMAVDFVLCSFPDDELTIWTDSQYVIGLFTKDWNAKVNKELITSIREKLKTRRIHFKKADGHSDDPMNKKADRLAYAIAGCKRVEEPQKES